MRAEIATEIPNQARTGWERVATEDAIEAAKNQSQAVRCAAGPRAAPDVSRTMAAPVRFASKVEI